jgi:hypothetical protein
MLAATIRTTTASLRTVLFKFTSSAPASGDALSKSKGVWGVVGNPIEILPVDWSVRDERNITRENSAKELPNTRIARREGTVHARWYVIGQGPGMVYSWTQRHLQRLFPIGRDRGCVQEGFF